MLNIAKSTESRNTILRKLGIFGSIAIGLFIIGKNILLIKNHRHELESDSSTLSSRHQDEEFGYVSSRPGFP